MLKWENLLITNKIFNSFGDNSKYQHFNYCIVLDYVDWTNSFQNIKGWNPEVDKLKDTIKPFVTVKH